VRITVLEKILMGVPEQDSVLDMGILPWAFASALRLMMQKNCVRTIDDTIALLANPEAQVSVIEADLQFLIVTLHGVENTRGH
jgi:hypothetical protein